ncbi:MAG TPA: DUF4157 domain-containing protein [Acidimicrobiales bacterium]|jgi:hypothetical protein|nr:DUF4157 domain-containing protein [Acidimicrobiales bacterium]
MGQSRLAGPTKAPVASSVSAVVSEPGTPVPAHVAVPLGAEMGHDFSDVRVHADDRAGASARAVGAEAYTVGRHIAFAPGQYRPGDGAGQGLLRHELVHTMQQAGQAAPSAGMTLESGPNEAALEREAGAQAPGHASPTGRPVLQRQPAPGADDAALEAVFTEYEKLVGRKPNDGLKDWARRYQAARRDNPEAAPLTAETLKGANELWKTHGVWPPVPTGKKLPAGGLGANEVLPFATGSRVLVTDLLREHIPTIKRLVGLIGGKNVPPDAKALLDVLSDPNTPVSLAGTVVESTPLVFRAKVAVPELPAQGLKARTVEIALEATDQASKFDLEIGWGTGRQFFDVTARREGGKIVVSTTVAGQKVDAALEPTKSGGVVASTDHPAARVLSDKPLKLVSIEPLKEQAGTEAAAKEQAATQKTAAASATPPPARQEVGVGGGVKFGGATPAVSLGYRFTFRVLGDTVGVPVAVQLDYVPKLGLGTVGVGAGGQLRGPVAGVPMSLSVVGGVKGGVVGLGGDTSSAVFGPSIAARGAIDLGPRTRVFVGYEYFKNMLDAAEGKQDVGGVHTIQAGAALRF